MKSIEMESPLLQNRSLVRHILDQLLEACDLVMFWNKDVSNSNEYPVSPQGVQIMAASCMLIESIGEGIKKIDRLAPCFLETESPNTPWREIKGLRDHVAHGYFDLDADIIFNVVKEEIPLLRVTIKRIIDNFC